MKRVCIYCQTWESGGIEAFISNILTHMDLSELDVDIVADVLKESVFTDKLKTAGITFRELSGSQRSVIQNYRLFMELMREQNYDVIHLNVFQALPLAYLLVAKRSAVSVRIAHSHNTMLRKSATRVLKMMIHKTASRVFANAATDLWSCSADAARFMFPASVLRKRECRFIPNGIELSRFRFDLREREKLREQLNLDNAFVIGNVGRLCYQKNQSFLIDVFYKIHARDSSARLLLVGEGEDKPLLREKAQRLGIAENVIFYGVTPHVEQLLWAMDVFIFPSRFEGLGIAAVEAQAAGLPILCSEKIPQETLITNHAFQIDLSARARDWADAALRLGVAADRDRRKGADAVCAAGFDVAATAEMVRGVWREGGSWIPPKFQ